MDDEQKEIEAQIEQIKKEIDLFMILAEKTGLSNEDREKQIDLYLEDIFRLMEKIKK